MYTVYVTLDHKTNHKGQFYEMYKDFLYFFYWYFIIWYIRNDVQIKLLEIISPIKN